MNFNSFGFLIWRANKKKEEEYMIEKYYNVLYIEKEWIENDYFMRIKLFVKQNNSDNPKSNI